MSFIGNIAFKTSLLQFEKMCSISNNKPEIGYFVVSQFEEIARLFDEKRLFEVVEADQLSKKLRDLSAAFPESSDTKIADYISSGKYQSKEFEIETPSWKVACFLSTGFCLTAQGYSIASGKAFRTGSSLRKLRPFMPKFDRFGAILFGQHQRAQEYAH